MTKKVSKTLEASRSTWKYFFEGDPYYDSLKKDLLKAKHSIDLEVYIYSPNEVGRMFADILKKKSLQGVQVRVHIDALGSYDLPSDFFSHSKVQLQIYKPVGLFSIFIPAHHRRNHRKLIVIDKQICYIGGMNISEFHSKRISGNDAWRDTMLRLQGSNIGTEAAKSFERTWIGKSKMDFRSSLSYQSPFQFFENSKNYLRRANKKILVSSLLSAKNRIWFQTAYFVPRPFLVRHLIRSAKRGVDVRISVSETSDVDIAKWAGEHLFHKLLKKHVKIYLYTGRFLHSKAAIIDDWGMVGSSNLDHRSFLSNLEIDVAIRDSNAIAVLAKQLELDFRNSRKLSPEVWNRRPVSEKLLSRFFYMFRYFL